MYLTDFFLLPAHSHPLNEVCRTVMLCSYRYFPLKKEFFLIFVDVCICTYKIMMLPELPVTFS